ncbi:MAG: hypothetical protein RIQ47_1751, partial [Bacteroidota bacterium]
TIRQTPLLLSICFISLFSVKIAEGQGLPVAIGNWRDHVPYSKAIDIEEVNDRIYCASRFGLFSFQKFDGGLNRFTRLNGLSDVEIAGIYYDPSTQILLISYENSNIDLLYVNNLSIINIPDIKRKNIVGGKRINDALFYNRKAYLATDFGIIVIDLDRKEIKDTYYIGPGGSNLIVNGLAFNGNELLAATSSGIRTAQINDPNIFNFTGWTQEVNGLSNSSSRFTSATSFNGNFIVINSNANSNTDTVLQRVNGSWQVLLQEFTRGARVDSLHRNFIYSNSLKASAYDTTLSLYRTVDGNTYYPPQINDAFVDVSGQYWLADNQRGLVQVNFNPTYVLNHAPTGPGSEAVYAMDSREGTLWVASGSLSGFAPEYDSKNGCYVLNNNDWKSFNRSNDTLYDRINLPAMVAVAVDPSNPQHAYFGNWRGGVLEYNTNGGVRQFDENNSTLLSKTGLQNYILAGGVTFDSNGTLWVAAGGTTSPISARYANGTWKSFQIRDASVANLWLFQTLVDDYGTKWVISYDGPSAGAGIIVFNENDPDNPNDDSYRQLTDRVGSGALPDIFVRSMAKDKDGSIWVGTNKGVGVFYNPSEIFSSSNFDAQRVIIEQDGYAQYLLESEYVTSVVIDGANRKWFGTYGGGVFLLSEDGTKQLLNFNTDNSPLPSNNIACMTVDNLTGELFIGTDKGIVSYRSDATNGGTVCDGYYAFPNPVKHDYVGTIAIRGLVDDADVRITDTAGNIVYHTKALGGQAIWDGNDFSGRRAATGVYFAHVTNADGSATCVTKILMAK